MKIFIYPFVVILLLLTACSNTAPEQNTVYSATIYDINLRVNKMKWISGEKLNLSAGNYELAEINNIFNQKGDKIDPSDLKIGDKIKIYLKPPVIIKETEPAQISAEYILKIIK
ncbi:hypothetical protein LIBO111022_15890 [Listeria booriae]|uniref:DUF3221 domain-containing protein n=1 Tax=Listeria booriae TaxID=1552123 RepID=A0A099WI46_9LIST|nr:hypothetical protein [Listeria booriae]KGL44346.1 hypothetical protein EP57_01775 [Listeria booriae]STY46270.1 Uncharacterised protein [Listeria booriae]